MEKKIIEGTEDTPEIVLDKDNNIFKFAGKSLPEDVKEFYAPIMEWIDDYANNPNETTKVVFKMEYFNSASSKRIVDILTQFEEIKAKGANILVDWYYQDDDEDMQDAGEAFASIVDLPFNMISY
ncbi:MAG: nuclear pore complex subunit [Bacteroidetes bacterium]|nr:MAG: nuclear pore complex subunit [Bacteroidota bacterium]